MAAKKKKSPARKSKQAPKKKRAAAKPARAKKAVKKAAPKARTAKKAKARGKSGASKDVVYTDVRRTLTSKLFGRLLGTSS